MFPFPGIQLAMIGAKCITFALPFPRWVGTKSEKNRNRNSSISFMAGELQWSAFPGGNLTGEGTGRALPKGRSSARSEADFISISRMSAAGGFG